MKKNVITCGYCYHSFYLEYDAGNVPKDILFDEELINLIKESKTGQAVKRAKEKYPGLKIERFKEVFNNNDHQMEINKVEEGRPFIMVDDEYSNKIIYIDEYRWAKA